MSPHQPLNPLSVEQLFDPDSSTYTYVLWDSRSKQAVLIDPVDAQLQRDLDFLQKHQLNLLYVMETHAHADHITSAAALIEHTGAQAATPVGCGIRPSAIQLQDGDVLGLGGQSITALHTPGHTAGSMCFLTLAGVFTGDTLLIGGCGRTDFQSGSARDLYRSLTQVLLQLPDETVVWPGHDYKGKQSSTIGQEKRSNARLLKQDGQLRSEAEFVALMDSLNLPTPKRIHEAVPANLSLGVRHDAQVHISDVPKPVANGSYAGDVSPQLAWAWWQSGAAALVDVRTDAERAWVGFVPDALAIEWKSWPGMQANLQFDAQLRTRVSSDKPVMFLCRSGVRSIAAAQKATELGYVAYNILEGFEGNPDEQAHRGTKGGWRFQGLPWRQS